MNKSLRLVVGVLISGFFLWLASRNFDLALLRESLQKIKPSWVWAALAVYLTGHILRSVRWSILLSTIQRVSAYAVFPILMFGFLVNNLIPGRAGELAKSVAAGKRFQISTASALGTVALERLSDLLGLLSILLVAIRVFEPAKKAFPSVLGSLVLLTFLFYLFVKYLPKIKTKVRPNKISEKIFLVTDHLIDGLKSAGSFSVIFPVGLLSLLIWWAEVTTLYLLARSFSLDLTFPQSSATMSGISMGVMIPASPGFVGTYEYFGKQTLILMGHEPGISFVFIGFLHLFQMGISSLLGLPYLFQMGSIKSRGQTQS